MPASPTPRMGLTAAAGADAANTIDTTMQDVASDIDAIAVIFSQGTFASRPTSTAGTPGKQGRFYYATDTGVLYYDHGTGWVGMLPPDGAVTTAKLADGAVTTAKVALGAWVTPTLNAPWTSPDSNMHPAQYRKGLGGEIFLRGHARRQPSASDSIFTLPAGFRPLKTLHFPVRWWDATTFGSGELEVTPAGTVTPQNTNAFGWVYLDGIAFFTD